VQLASLDFPEQVGDGGEEKKVLLQMGLQIGDVEVVLGEEGALQV